MNTTRTEMFTQPFTATVVGLTAAQADGLACVACGVDYLRVRVAHRPVGRSVTGSQVFACVPACPPPDGDAAEDAAVRALRGGGGQ